MWVWEPIVTRPVATASRSAAHETGGAPYGSSRCSSTNAVARYSVAGIAVLHEERHRDVGEVGGAVVEGDDHRVERAAGRVPRARRARRRAW